MSALSFDTIIAAIDDNLDHLHKQLWDEQAARLHDAEAKAEPEQLPAIRRALSDHYAIRFKPETTRTELIEQARKNYDARQAT